MSRYFTWKYCLFVFHQLYIWVEGNRCVSVWHHSITTLHLDGKSEACQFPTVDVLNQVTIAELGNNRLFLNPFKNYMLEYSQYSHSTLSCVFRLGSYTQNIDACHFPMMTLPDMEQLQLTPPFRQFLNTTTSRFTFANETVDPYTVFVFDSDKVTNALSSSPANSLVEMSYGNVVDSVIYAFRGYFQGVYRCNREYSILGVGYLSTDPMTKGTISTPSTVNATQIGALESTLSMIDDISSQKIFYIDNGRAFMDVLSFNTVSTCRSIHILPQQYVSHKDYNITNYQNHTEVILQLNSMNSTQRPIHFDTMYTLIDSLRSTSTETKISRVVENYYQDFQPVSAARGNVVWEFYSQSTALDTTSTDSSRPSGDGIDRTKSILAISNLPVKSPNSSIITPQDNLSPDMLAGPKEHIPQTKMEQQMQSVLNKKQVHSREYINTGIMLDTNTSSTTTMNADVKRSLDSDIRPVTAYINIGSVFNSVDDDYYSFRLRSTNIGMFCSGEQSFRTPGTIHNYQSFYCMAIPWQRQPILILKSLPRSEMRDMQPCASFVAKRSIFDTTNSSPTRSETELAYIRQLTTQNKLTFPLLPDAVWDSVSVNSTQSSIRDSDQAKMWNAGIRSIYVGYAILNSLGDSSIVWASITLLPPTYVNIPIVHFAKYIPTIYDNSYFSIYPIALPETYDGQLVHDDTLPVRLTRPLYNAMQTTLVNSRISIYWTLNSFLNATDILGSQQWESRISISYTHILAMWPQNIPLNQTARIFFRNLSVNERLNVAQIVPDELIDFNFEYTDVAKGGDCVFTSENAREQLQLPHSMPLVNSIIVTCSGWTAKHCEKDPYCSQFWYGLSLLLLDNEAEEFAPFKNVSFSSGKCLKFCDSIENQISDHDLSYTAQQSKHFNENHGSASYSQISPFYNSAPIIDKTVSRQYLSVSIEKAYRVASHIVDRFQQLTSFMELDLVDMEVMPTGNQLIFVLPGAVEPNILSAQAEQIHLSLHASMLGLIQNIQYSKMVERVDICPTSQLGSLFYIQQQEALTSDVLEYQYAGEVLIDARRFTLTEIARNQPKFVGFSQNFTGQISDEYSDADVVRLTTSGPISATYLKSADGLPWTDITENFDIDAISKLLDKISHLGLDIYYTTHNTRLYTLGLINNILQHAVTPSMSLCSAIEPSWRHIALSLIRMVRFIHITSPSQTYSGQFYQARLLNLPPPPTTIVPIPSRVINLSLVDVVNTTVRLFEVLDLENMEQRCNLERFSQQLYFSNADTVMKQVSIEKKKRKTYETSMEQTLHALETIATIRACFSHSLIVVLLFLEKHKTSIGKAIMPVFFAERYATHTSAAMGNMMFGRYALQNLAEPMALANLPINESPYIRYVNNIVTVGTSYTNINDGPFTLSFMPAKSPGYADSIYNQPCGHLSSRTQRVSIKDFFSAKVNITKGQTLSSISYLEVTLYQMELPKSLVQTIGQLSNQHVTPGISVHVSFRTYAVNQPMETVSDDVILEKIEQTPLNSRANAIVYLLPNVQTPGLDLTEPLRNENPVKSSYLSIGMVGEEEHVLQCMQLKHLLVQGVARTFSLSSSQIGSGDPWTPLGCYAHSVTSQTVVCVCSSPGITYARTVPKSLVAFEEAVVYADESTPTPQLEHFIGILSPLAALSLAAFVFLFFIIPCVCHRKDKALIAATMRAYAFEWKEGNPCVNNLTYLRACFGNEFTDTLLKSWLSSLHFLPIPEQEEHFEPLTADKLTLVWPSKDISMNNNTTTNDTTSNTNVNDANISIPLHDHGQDPADDKQNTKTDDIVSGSRNTENASVFSDLTRCTSFAHNNHPHRVVSPLSSQVRSKYVPKAQARAREWNSQTRNPGEVKDPANYTSEVFDAHEEDITPESLPLLFNQDEEKKEVYDKVQVSRLYLFTLFMYEFLFSSHSLISVLLPQLGDGLSVTLKAYLLVVSLLLETVIVLVLYSTVEDSNSFSIVVISGLIGSVSYATLRTIFNSTHRHRLLLNFFQFVRAIARNEVEGKHTGYFGPECDVEFHTPLTPQELEARYEETKLQSQDLSLPVETREIYQRQCEYEEEKRVKVTAASSRQKPEQSQNLHKVQQGPLPSAPVLPSFSNTNSPSPHYTGVFKPSSARMHTYHSASLSLMNNLNSQNANTHLRTFSGESNTGVFTVPSETIVYADNMNSNDSNTSNNNMNGPMLSPSRQESGQARMILQEEEAKYNVSMTKNTSQSITNTCSCENITSPSILDSHQTNNSTDTANTKNNRDSADVEHEGSTAHSNQDVLALLDSLRLNKMKSKVSSSAGAVLQGIYWNWNVRPTYKSTAESLRANASVHEDVNELVISTAGDTFKDIVHDMRRQALDGYSLPNEVADTHRMGGMSTSKPQNSIARAGRRKDEDHEEEYEVSGMSRVVHPNQSPRANELKHIGFHRQVSDGSTSSESAGMFAKTFVPTPDGVKHAITQQPHVNIAQNLTSTNFPHISSSSQVGPQAPPDPLPYFYTPETEPQSRSSFLSDQRQMLSIAKMSPFCTIRPKEYVENVMFNEDCSPYFYLGTPLQFQSNTQKMLISPKLYPFVLPFQNMYQYSQVPCPQEQAKQLSKSSTETESLHRLSYQLMREVPAVCSVCMLITAQCRCEAALSVCPAKPQSRTSANTDKNVHMARNISKARVNAISQLASWFTVISAPLKIPYTRNSMNWKVGISSGVAAEDILLRLITTCKECSYIRELCVCRVKEHFDELQKLQKKMHLDHTSNVTTAASLHKIWTFITRRTEEIANASPPKLQKEDSRSYRALHHQVGRHHRGRDQMRMFEQLGMWQQFTPREMLDLLQPVFNTNHQHPLSLHNSMNSSNGSVTDKQDGHQNFDSMSTGLVTEEAEMKHLQPPQRTHNTLNLIRIPSRARSPRVRDDQQIGYSPQSSPPLVPSSPPLVSSSVEMTDKVHSKNNASHNTSKHSRQSSSNRQTSTSFHTTSTNHANNDQTTNSTAPMRNQTMNSIQSHSGLYCTNPKWIAPLLVSKREKESKQAKYIPEAKSQTHSEAMALSVSMYYANKKVAEELSVITGYNLFKGVPSCLDPRDGALNSHRQNGMFSQAFSQSTHNTKTMHNAKNNNSSRTHQGTTSSMASGTPHNTCNPALCEDKNCMSHVLQRRAVDVHEDDLIYRFLYSHPLHVIPYQITATDDYGRASKTDSRMIRAYILLAVVILCLLFLLATIFITQDMPAHYRSNYALFYVLSTWVIELFVLSPLILCFVSFLRMWSESTSPPTMRYVFTPLHLQNRLHGDLSTHTCCYQLITWAQFRMEIAMQTFDTCKNEKKEDPKVKPGIPPCTCGVSQTQAALYPSLAFRGIFDDPFGDSSLRGYNDNINAYHTSTCAMKMYIQRENRRSQASGQLWWRDRGISATIYSAGQQVADQILEDIAAQPAKIDEMNSMNKKENIVIAQDDIDWLQRSVAPKRIKPNVYDFLDNYTFPTQVPHKASRDVDVQLKELSEVVDRTKGWVMTNNAIQRGPLRTWEDTRQTSVKTEEQRKSGNFM